ncbi:hypothetical protein BDD43_5004 [Mucilaginibacter gracilis]|uniref:Uncharacterized protein n=1 Tax=Mucilaginibacter gracilis TaxID=423350 RepID=A0A495J898_9SPHI|nr:hypothetical protein [Mucilaginibacter gracilis]RKR84752.1 hypothetical protein BDD43_5004 [Mucilaginibacter gracilis]
MKTQQFNVIPGSFNTIRKTILVRAIPLLLIMAVTGIFITTATTTTTEVNIWPYLIPFMCLMLSFGLFRGIKKQRLLFESYELTIDNDTLVRKQFNTATIAMPVKEVNQIVKSVNGSFIIKGKSSNSNIIVPAQIDNYAQLETTLNRIKPVTVKQTTNFFAKYAGYAGAAISAVLMICVYTVNNKIVVGTAGLLLVALMAWSFYKIRASKNTDAKTKRSSLYIVIALIAIIVIVYTKLAA